VKTAFRESFARDLKAIRDKKLRQRVKEVIEAIEKADSLSALPNLKKLKGVKSYFRLKLRDYRIGLALVPPEVKKLTPPGTFYRADTGRRMYLLMRQNYTARSVLEIIGVPYGSRTRVAAVKGRCPRPLDERDAWAGII
jgi:mRNA interferase RelE/StbE